MYSINIPGVSYCRVIVSESAKYAGYFAVAVLHPQNGEITAANGLERGEANAIKWAEYWLNQKYRGVALLGSAEGDTPSRPSSWTAII